MILECDVNVNVDAREYGQRLAKCDNEEQAEFFEGLREGFDEISEGDKDGLQMLYIKDLLSDETVAFIKKLVEYVCTGR